MNTYAIDNIHSRLSICFVILQLTFTFCWKYLRSLQHDTEKRNPDLHKESIDSFSTYN